MHLLLPQRGGGARGGTLPTGGERAPPHPNSPPAAALPPRSSPPHRVPSLTVPPHCAASLHMQALEPVLEGDCHFTPEDPGDEKTRALLCQRLSSRLLEGVAESRAVLLLQTPSAYTDALTLLELYWAIRQKKTIICLRLQDSPYDFSEVLALSHQSPDRSQY